MKYIKQLKIDFNDWDNIDYPNDLLDKFFNQDEFNKCDQTYYLYNLIINKESIPYIKQYIIDNNIGIRWASGDNLLRGINYYFKEYNYIVLVLSKHNKIFKTDINNICYNQLDFRK